MVFSVRYLSLLILQFEESSWQSVQEVDLNVGRFLL